MMFLFEIWINGEHFGTVHDALRHSYISQLVEHKILSIMPDAVEIEFRAVLPKK